MATTKTELPATPAVYAEKEYQAEIEDTSSNSKRDSNEGLATFSPKNERKLRHKIDARLIYCLGLMYGVSLMDRKNVSIKNGQTLSINDAKCLTG